MLLVICVNALFELELVKHGSASHDIQLKSKLVPDAGGVVEQGRRKGVARAMGIGHPPFATSEASVFHFTKFLCL